ncbi:MAG: hypothetical protein JST86_14800 [Bacteroidetes bacterium]|nr:hypothetical protein [Bacteroidota bacterium]
MVLISVIIIVLFILPFGNIIDTGNDSNQGLWIAEYLWEDWLTLSFFLPFILSWIILLTWPRAFKKILFKILLGITAGFVFLISGSSVAMAGQDYEPSIGAMLSVFIFPLYIFLLIFKNAEEKDNTPKNTIK